MLPRYMRSNYAREINKDREEHGKQPFDDDPPNQPPEEKVVTKSTTDPDSGVFHKGEHKKCFAYCAQTACDSHNFVLGVTVNSGQHARQRGIRRII